MQANPTPCAPRNTLALGDCCAVMPTLPAATVDFVLTDPPYLVNYRDRAGRGIAGDSQGGWLVPAFAQIYRVLRDNALCVSFYGWSRTDEFFAAWRRTGFRVVGHITMPKRYTSASRLMRYQHENAYLLAKGSPAAPRHVIGDVIDWTYTGNEHHPTQKPLSVLTPLIESFCPVGGLVMDPFAGSASTCVAARSIGRDYFGIELDRGYHAAALRRLAHYERAVLGRPTVPQQIPAAA